MEQIQKDASKTPFDVKGLTQANQLLISTGLSAEDSREVILALGDAVSATGGGNDELSRMAVNLQQIKNTGKATSLDIKQFAYAGIDIYGLLADYTGKTREEVAEMEVTWDNLNGALIKASKEGGKYFGAMEKQSETLNGKVSNFKDSFNQFTGSLTKTFLPTIKKVLDKLNDWMNKFEKMDDKTKKIITTIALLLATIGPLLIIVGKISTGIGSIISLASNLTGAIKKIKGATDTASSGLSSFSKALNFLKSPIGIVTTAITALAILVASKMKEMHDDTLQSTQGIADGITGWFDSLNNARSYLDDFDSTLFASAESQEKLKNNMQDIQNKITEICQRATTERRGYTTAEIKQLDKYFDDLNALSEQELNVQKSIGQAIIDQAKARNQAFSGTFEEYQVLMQEQIKTAEENRDKELDIIKGATTTQLALLKQRYGDKATEENEEYVRERQAIIDREAERIRLANDEVQQVVKIFQSRNDQLFDLQGELGTKIARLNNQTENEMNRHSKELGRINNLTGLAWASKNIQREMEEGAHQGKMKGIWMNTTKDLSAEEQKQLGNYLAYIMEFEAKGGQLTEQQRRTANAIIDAYEYMPKDMKNIMRQSMQGAIEGLNSKSPELLARASSISNSVISRIKKVMDIRSPSHVMEKLFGYVVEGAEKGLEKNERSLWNATDRLAEGVLDSFSIEDLAQRLKAVVDVENTKIATSLNSSVNKVFTANISLNGNVEMDRRKVGRLVAPNVSKTFISGGAYVG